MVTGRLPSWRQQGWGAAVDIDFEVPGTSPPEVLAERRDLICAPPLGPAGAPRNYIFQFGAQITAVPPGGNGASALGHFLFQEGCGQITGETATYFTLAEPPYPGSPPERGGWPNFLTGLEIRVGVRILGAGFSYFPVPGPYRARVQIWIAPWGLPTANEVPL